MKDLRTILHVDMDAFFASVEQRDNKDLRGQPVVVGGLHRGVVAAASYEARAFGIRSAMATQEALRRCPKLLVIAPRRAAYVKASAQAFAIFARYTPVIEPLSLDEAFLDVTGSRLLFGTGRTIAERIRAEVSEELDLPCSAGVSSNKFIAKIACEMAKPRGVFEVPKGQEAAFLAPLPIEKIFGVGEVTAARLHRAGIHTLADGARADPSRLTALLGPLGERIGRLARGIDDREVIADGTRKSISSESTLPHDLTSEAEIQRELLGHALTVAARLGASNLHAMGVHIKLKDSSFQVETRQVVLAHGVDDPDSIYQSAANLLQKISLKNRAFRLCGLGVHQLVEGPPMRQLFEKPTTERHRLMEAARRQINSRFGPETLTRASLLASERPSEPYFESNGPDRT